MHREASGSSLAGRKLLSELDNSRVVTIGYVDRLGQDHLIQMTIQT